MKIQTLQDALVHELQDLYSAETQLTKALPKMAKASTHGELSAAFEEHFEQTKGHVDRLEKAFELLDATKGREKCKGMEGLIEEGKKAIEEEMPGEVRDAILIGAAQRVEHYEIAGYGTARAFAKKLGHDDVAALLQDTLDEEAETDERLTDLASNLVNNDAELVEAE